MSATYTRITGPSVEPITLAEAKAHARIEIADDDAYITSLITAAREMLCRMLSKSLITETWALTLDAWPLQAGQQPWWDGVREAPISMLAAGHVAIERAPFLAISKVETRDEDDVATLWPASQWYATREGVMGRLAPRRSYSFPMPQRDWGSIHIEFTAGYGPTANHVPLAIRQALLMTVAHLYETRLPASECASRDLTPMGVGAIIQHYRTARAIT